MTCPTSSIAGVGIAEPERMLVLEGVSVIAPCTDCWVWPLLWVTGTQSGSRSVRPLDADAKTLCETIVTPASSANETTMYRQCLRTKTLNDISGSFQTWSEPNPSLMALL